MNVKYKKEKNALSYYDSKINYFDKNKLLNASMSKKTFNEILVKFNISLNDKKILDLGTGSGETTLHILNNYSIKYITAIDYSYNRIKNLIDIVEKYKYHNVNILNSDINYFLDKTKEKYDVIFCFEVIEHLENPKNVLNSLKTKLNNNGIIIGTLPLQEKSNNIHLSAFKSINDIKNKLNVNVSTDFEMRFKNQIIFYYNNN